MAKGDKFYFENFMACAELAKKAAAYLVTCFETYEPKKLDAMLKEMHDIEHSADKKKHEMSAALAKAFVTPVDREDLDALSHQLDGVPDVLEEALQKLYIYNIQTIEPMAVDYAKKLVIACDHLWEIMKEFENFKKSKKIHTLIIECNDIEEECDRLYMASMRVVTLSNADAQVKYSWYKIFDCLEECADACEHVAECVSSIIMKNT
ncbi:MAG: DUF47 family protein [Oscillospiraceae bacterium]|nr:DUF47 family protein [Oscillospiraceae bacterium]